jgi:hypothetical protein
MPHIYNFAIVRVSPDPRRGELVNIGVIVFRPDGPDVRILPSLAKVQALYGELDLSELHSLSSKFARTVPAGGTAAQQHRLMRRVGMVELSELGQFSARGNDEYHQIVEELMGKLVRPTAAPRPTEAAASHLKQQVRKVIRQVRLMGRKPEDIEKHKVVSHFPLAPDKGLYADFAGRNSRFYFTETIDFRVDRGIQGQKFNESTKAAFVLREAEKQFKNSNRTLLYAATAQTEVQVRPHLNLLGEFATDFVNFESSNDRAKYVQALVTALGDELPSM